MRYNSGERVMWVIESLLLPDADEPLWQPMCAESKRARARAALLLMREAVPDLRHRLKKYVPA